MALTIFHGPPQQLRQLAARPARAPAHTIDKTVQDTSRHVFKLCKKRDRAGASLRDRAFRH
ncbi:hypothetical protein ABTJ92_23330, partial [Acinetobacter baumannii]